jgi:hypothetical protein
MTVQTKERPLNTFQLAFGEYFYTPTSETYHNASKSASKAGYAITCAKEQGYKLAKHAGIRARFSGIVSSNPAVARIEEQVTREVIVRDLRRIQNLAEDDKKWSEALKALELIGKTAGLFADVVLINSAELAEFDTSKAQQARRIASVLLDGTAVGIEPAQSLLQSEIKPDAGPAPTPSTSTAQAMIAAALDGTTAGVVPSVEPEPMPTLAVDLAEPEAGLNLLSSEPERHQADDPQGTPGSPPTGAGLNYDSPPPCVTDFGASLGSLEIAPVAVPVVKVSQSLAGVKGSQGYSKGEYEQYWDESHRKWKRRKVGVRNGETV